MPRTKTCASERNIGAANIASRDAPSGRRPLKLAVLVGTRRDDAGPSAGFGVLHTLPDVLPDDDVRLLHVDDDMATAVEVDAGIGGPVDRIRQLFDVAPALRWH